MKLKYNSVVIKFPGRNLFLEVKPYRVIAAAIAHETASLPCCILATQFIEHVALLALLIH